MSTILETFTEDVDIFKIFFDNFETTGHPKHKVFNDVMQTFIKDNKINITKIVNISNTKGIEYKNNRVEGTEL